MRNVNVVYIVGFQDDSLVKIGTTNNLKKRLIALNCGSSKDLVVKRVIEGSFSLEKKFHKYFNEYHVRNEWFQFVPEMITIDFTKIDNENILSSLSNTQNYHTTKISFSREKDILVVTRQKF